MIMKVKFVISLSDFRDLSFHFDEGRAGMMSSLPAEQHMLGSGIFMGTECTPNRGPLLIMIRKGGAPLRFNCSR